MSSLSFRREFPAVNVKTGAATFEIVTARIADFFGLIRMRGHVHSDSRVGLLLTKELVPLGLIPRATWGPTRDHSAIVVYLATTHSQYAFPGDAEFSSLLQQGVSYSGESMLHFLTLLDRTARSRRTIERDLAGGLSLLEATSTARITLQPMAIRAGLTAAPHGSYAEQVRRASG